MKMARLAITLTAIGLLLCLWLFAGVAWYNFAAFMMVAKPLLVFSLLIFIVAVAREMRRRGEIP